ncbi:hypothetical protein B0H14DRAFT_68730 [Mycena olivaceomarginata]|nr:hypothetical protein B0H14DRAFT_68730 [Mycena olivaceomarginata]
MPFWIRSSRRRYACVSHSSDAHLLRACGGRLQGEQRADTDGRREYVVRVCMQIEIERILGTTCTTWTRTVRGAGGYIWSCTALSPWRHHLDLDNGSARRREIEGGWEWGTGTTGYAWPCTDPRLAERLESTGRKDPVLLSLLLISQDGLFTIRPSTLDVCMRSPHCSCPCAYLTFAAWLSSHSLHPLSAVSLADADLRRATRSTMGALALGKSSGNYDAYDERRDTAPRLVEISFSLQLISPVPFSPDSCSTDSLFTSPSRAFTVPSVDW